MRVVAPLVLFSAALLSGTPVITSSVSCAIQGQPAVTGTGSCTLGVRDGSYPPPPYASASASTSIQLQQAAADTLTISFLNMGQTTDGLLWYQEQGQYLNNFRLISIAGAQSNIHIDFLTSGEQRPGFMKWQWQPVWQGNPGDFSATASFSMDGYSGKCSGANAANCSGPGPNAPMLPFELGSAFAFDSSNSLRVDTGDGSISDGFAGMLLHFQFFESDGVTPVLALDPDPVPEPATWALVALAFIGAGVWRARRTC